MSSKPTVPDDDRANDPVLYVGVGLMSIGLIVAVLAALFFPPAIAAGFIIRGGQSGRPLLRYIGYALFLGWFVAFYFTGRRLMGVRGAPVESLDDEEDGEEKR